MQIVEQVAVQEHSAAIALKEFVRALARRQAQIDVAKLVAANDNQRPH